MFSMRTPFLDEEILTGTVSYYYNGQLPLNDSLEYLAFPEESLPSNTYRINVNKSENILIKVNQLSQGLRDLGFFEKLVELGFNLEFVLSKEVIDSGAKEIFEIFKSNYNAKIPLGSGLSVDQLNSYKDKIEKYMTIRIFPDENTHQKIKAYFDSYISNYEKNKLFVSDKNVISLKRHYEEYKKVIAYCSENFMNSNVVLEANLDYKFENNTIHRPIEFYMLMEVKGVIKIHGIKIKERILTCNVEILKDHKEMDDLYFNWIRFGNLVFNPKTGHAKNGNLALKHFSLNGPSFKAMQLFFEKFNELHSFEEIEKFCFGDESSTSKQLKDRINSLIDKQIRKPLKLNDPRSKVNILGVNNAFKLTALP